MRTVSFAGILVLAVFVYTQTTHAQTSCLLYPSNSTPPGMPYPYGASWDVTTPGKELLVKSNCPTSGNSIDITVGKGSTSQFIWQHSYLFNTAVTPPRWATTTLAGTVDANGWITSGSGTKTITTPFTATASNPLYFVGYVCTFHESRWKCGCANASCTNKYWQLQAYKGVGGGTTGGTGGTTGGSSASCIPDGACIQTATPGDLQSKLNAAPCGCKIKLASGMYSGNYTYSKDCGSGNQLTLESATPYGAKLSGRLTVSGNGLAVTGLEVINDAKVYLNGDNNRITRNKFTASTDRGPIEAKGAQNNEIDRNNFLGTRAIFLGFFVNRTADEVKNTHIHHNYFSATDPTNQHIAVYIGGYAAELHRDDMLAHANNLATFEYNMFENVRMSKALHVKSNRNTIRYNYVKNSAPMDVRQGQYNIIRENYIDGGNLGTHEEFNQFLCNRITGGSIDIFAGEGGLTQFGTYQSGTAKDTLVSGNNGRLVLGDMLGLHGHTVPDEPALRTEVRGHTGEIIERFHQNSTININAAPICTAPTAPPVTKSQVGVDAPCS